MIRTYTLLCLCFFSVFLNAQVAGDYQTIANGNWSTLAIWQTYNGVAWVPAGITPTAANANVITIQAGNTVTLNIGGLNIDQVIVNGTLQTGTTAATGSFTIVDGVGVDLTINGLFWDQLTTGVITWVLPATWQYGPTGTLMKTSASSSNNWQLNYNGGASTMPATANWILRRVGAAAVPALSTIGAYYPNLFIENNTGTNWVTTAASTFSGVGTQPIILGSLYVGGNGTNTVDFLNGNTNPTQTVTVNGDVTIKVGSNLRNYGTGFEVRGNLNVNGSITYDANDARRIVFGGGNNQTVNGAGALNVYDCILNKTGNSVTLNRAMTVDNLMTFTSGILNTTAVNLLTINSAGSVTGANNLSFVNGPCRYIGYSAFTFPVGKNSDYQALSYNATAGGGGIFWTEAFQNACSSGCAATGYTGPNGTWTVTSAFPNAGCGIATSPNMWYVSGAECGNAATVCGTACGITDPSLHVGSTSLGDIGAAYDAGGYCPFFGSPGTQTDARCESPTINCSGQTTISLNFNYIENGQGVNDNATVWYFDGTVWSQIDDPPKSTLCGGQGLWAARTIVLPASADNNPNVKIGFRWVNNDDGSGTDPSFAVDDITLSTTGPPCDFTCEYFYANPQVVYNNVLAPTLNSIDACEYWILTRNAGVVNKIITLTWDGNTCPAIPLTSDTRVAHFDLSMWQDEGNGGNTGTTAAGTVTSAAAVTYYGPFTIGLIPPTPLPIEMLRFDGTCTGHSIQLNWSTGTENNNDYFTIERAVDGQTFSSIGIVDGAGNSNHLIQYSFFDTDPSSGTNYYRIRQTDFNGQYSLSKIIAVNGNDCDKRNLTLNNAWFNNSTLEVDYFNGEAAVSIEIYSADGKLVKHSTQLPTESHYQIEAGDLSSSVYFLRITDGITSITRTLQK
jgi:hypothetical protein